MMTPFNLEGVIILTGIFDIIRNKDQNMQITFYNVETK
jgi:hypothetical protein